MRKFLMIAVGLASLGILAQPAFAAKNCGDPADKCSDTCLFDSLTTAQYGTCMRACSTKYNACIAASTKASKKKSDQFIREQAKIERELFDSRKVANDKAAHEAALKEWEANGKKYTSIVIFDQAGPNTGTSTVSFKVGVPPADGADMSMMKVLGPDGHHYAPWDPKLNALLEKAGIKDGNGKPMAYQNDKAMLNEIALKQDQEARKRAIAAGKPIPPPTGTRNNDALGNAAPKVNDHRNEKTKTSSTSSTLNTPPPAGTSTGIPASSPNAPVVRDHRKDKPGYVPGGSGGITVTQTPRPAAGGALQPPRASNATSQK